MRRIAVPRLAAITLMLVISITLPHVHVALAAEGTKEKFGSSAKAQVIDKDGKVVGLKMTKIKKGSIYEMVGLQEGDVITSYNGHKIKGAQDARKIFDAFKSKSNRKVELVALRGKQEVHLSYSVDNSTERKPGPDCEKLGVVKSVVSETKVKLTFRNKTAEEIDVVWLGFQGEKKRYATITPGGFVEQETFLTHPWLIEDQQGRCLGLYMPDLKKPIIEII